jgi:hypothetical protein
MPAARLDARCYLPLLCAYLIEFIIKFLLTRYWLTDKSSEIGRLELCPAGPLLIHSISITVLPGCPAMQGCHVRHEERAKRRCGHRAPYRRRDEGSVLAAKP